MTTAGYVVKARQLTNRLLIEFWGSLLVRINHPIIEHTFCPLYFDMGTIITQGGINIASGDEGS